MAFARTALLLTAATLAVGCMGNSGRQTLAGLHGVEPDVKEVQIENGLEQAMQGYRDFLREAPVSALTPEAMRRLADLQLEKEFGILGGAEIPTHRATAIAGATDAESANASVPASIAPSAESEEDFERRVASQAGIAASGETFELELPGDSEVEWAGPEEAIALYDRILTAYPNYEHNDQVLYQKARAYDELGKTDEAIVVIEQLVTKFPQSSYIDEVQFRRGEYFFTRHKYYDAELAYAAATEIGPSSPFYELALYKLGWTLYKQEYHDEALHKYIALLDYKISTGYDFDRPSDETEERRVADTYRVISLSFSSLGGPTAVRQYFATNGHRAYEDRIYSHLGEFYLEKLRYNDAAVSYKAFVELNPLHKTSPHFGIRVVEIYEAGGFPKLVLKSKKEFAGSYGVQSAYWVQFKIEESPEVVSYLRSNLEDLATHYHAVFQDKRKVDEKPENFREALHWYREYLASFSQDPKAPSIHYQLADLLLEHEDFGLAAREYEHTAYDYAEHEQAAPAGYAAIFAHRENEKQAVDEQRAVVRNEAVASTLRFVDTFPKHKHAAVVLGAAVDDLYEMKEYERAIATGQRLIDGYPEADPVIRRAAWASIAHSFFDTEDFVQAEHAYGSVLEMLVADDDSHQAVVDSLAAAIYKQGELANVAADYRAAADHFLRIPQLAPTSAIRPAAEYDAGAALIRLEDWAGAAAVLEAFRENHPEHELQREATKQIALVYRSEGNLSRAAEEYERVAGEAEESELRREALLIAGELYEESKVIDRALAVYLGFVKQFPQPLEVAVETRFKIAELYKATNDTKRHEEQLRKIVAIGKSAGAAGNDRIRFFAAKSALALTVHLYHRFGEVKLVQPFDKNLKKKKKRMDEALAGFEALVDYEVGEATAGATYYIAEIYFDFSQSLLESERPGDLSGADLMDYEMVLEEEAFPFEEQAIEVHEKNLELMAVGVYNRWIEKSLGKLAALMPGRYAKFEESSGLITSIDKYAYQVPEVTVELEAEPAAGGAMDSEEPDLPANPVIEVESAQQSPPSELMAAG